VTREGGQLILLGGQRAPVAILVLEQIRLLQGQGGEFVLAGGQFLSPGRRSGR